MKEYFQRLFEFNHWANEKIWTFLKENHIEDPGIIKIASHITNAERNWYYRVVHQQRDVPVWDILTQEAIALSTEQIGKKNLHFIAGLSDSDLSTAFDYNNLAGEAQLSTMQDVLAHIVNHSTYHRGQIIYLIRQLGITPPGTDFISFARLN